MTEPDTLRTRHDNLVWTSPTTVLVDGVSIEFDDDFEATPHDGRLIVLKHPDFLKEYVSVLGDRLYPRVLELGVFDGGSCILFSHLFGVERLSALDLIHGSPRFDAYRAAAPFRDRIRAHYETSQDDKAALEAILSEDFDAPPDLIIDDASHFLPESTRSFEILFPRLAPGGWYVLEDWSWAHFPIQLVWHDQPSLAHLLFRLQIAWISRPDLIADIVVRRHMAFIRKHPDAPVGGELSLDDICNMRGRTLQPF